MASSGAEWSAPNDIAAASTDELHDAVTGSTPSSLHGDEADESITITLSHHGRSHPFTLPPSATLADLPALVAARLSIPPANQKYLLPTGGMQRPPFRTPDLPLTTLPTNKPIKLLGDPAATHAALDATLAQAVQSRTRASPIPAATPARTRPTPSRAAADARYTFHTLRPLATLPDPASSLAFLQRLAADAGIRAAMRAHRFSVGLLTEMDPAAHTTRDGGRTLGLNRNGGEVVELRLRTDDGRGYRDYRTVRRTLCHELAHNVHGDHDRDFWELYRRIEGEVERNDYRTGGRSVGGVEYAPERPAAGGGEEEHVDAGGWTGGEFVLGGGGGVVGSTGGPLSAGGMSRREILARAAEERAKAARRAGDDAKGEHQGE